VTIRKGNSQYTVNANELCTKALTPGVMPIQNIYRMWVDHKGAEFMSNKQTNI